MSNLINITNQFYTAFNTHDIEQVKPFLHADVTFDDWNVNDSGKDEVCDSFINHFNIFPGIKGNVTSLTVDEEKAEVTAEVDTFLDNDRTIKVRNVISFEGTLIKAISAVKIEE